MTFESNEQSPEHCRWVSLNDENGFYIGNTIVFGDYGIGYYHYGKLSKLNKQDVFDSESLEFYYTILNRLNEFDRIEYTNQFITANISAYQISNSGKEFFDKAIKKAKTIAQKLIGEAEVEELINGYTVNVIEIDKSLNGVGRKRISETKNHHSKFAPSSQGVKSRKTIEDDIELTM